MKSKFIVQRLFYTLFMFIFVITFNFVLFRMMPGDPLSIVAKQSRSTPESRAVLERMYGLDKPLSEQYLNYVKSMITFDFGMSFNYKEPVRGILLDKAKNSLVLAMAAVPLGIFMGIAGGSIAAAAHGKTKDSILTSTSMIIYAVPSFWLAMIFLLYFGVKWRLVPINGMVTAGVDFKSWGAYLKNLAWHLVIPAISYALAIFGGYFLIMRSSMIDVFTEDFVLTARAKGLTKNQVIRRHVMPNALLPVTTMVVTSLALMFTGAFSIEVLFSWPGMGRLMVDSVSRQDYPVMQATNYIIAVVIILANLFVDILYSYLDPRVRIE